MLHYLFLFLLVALASGVGSLSAFVVMERYYQRKTENQLTETLWSDFDPKNLTDSTPTIEFSYTPGKRARRD